MCSAWYFALAYGYAAAKWRRAEIILILVDICNPSRAEFLAGRDAGVVALFPAVQLGVELGSIILISRAGVEHRVQFYSSLKTIRADLREAAIIYRFSGWQRFLELDLPFRTIGLVWNSMMSVAGGWFFLLACENVLCWATRISGCLARSYLQTAAGHGNTRAMLWGLGAMVASDCLDGPVHLASGNHMGRQIQIWQVESAAGAPDSLLNFLRRRIFFNPVLPEHSGIRWWSG